MGAWANNFDKIQPQASGNSGVSIFHIGQATEDLVLSLRPVRQVGNAGMNPEVPFKEATRMVYKGHSISHSLPIGVSPVETFGCAFQVRRQTHMSCADFALRGMLVHSNWANPQTENKATPQPRVWVSGESMEADPKGHGKPTRFRR